MKTQFEAATQSRIVAGARFAVRTILSAGTYPLWWVARRSPSLHRQAVVLRAQRITSPDSNPSSWPWIRKAWLAWISTLAVGTIIFICVSMTFLPILFHARTLPVLAALTIAMVLPQTFVMVELIQVLWHTFFPERICAYLSSRWQIALKRSEQRLRNLSQRKQKQAPLES